MNKIYIIANWKMNPLTLAEAKRNFEIIKKGIRNIKNVKAVICSPFVFLGALRPSEVLSVGGQDCFWQDKGAFTGEVSPRQLKNLGVEYVILGHSERRRYLAETDEMILKKTEAALSVGIKPIVCVEKSSQLKGFSKNIIVAYEPVFAIGTGKPCTVEKAKSVRKKIKQQSVLYGGSVNSSNAYGYIREAGFQGLLVGSASLDPNEFVRIVREVDFSSKT